MALPLALDFGPENEVIEINVNSDLTRLGYDLTHEKLLLLREALKQAATVLIYRVGTGGKAAAVEGSLSVKALYGGTRGNDISVVSKENVNITGAFDVETYLEGRLVDNQTAKNIEELADNRLVSFTGEGELTAFSIVLENGTNTAATASDYMKFFSKIQVFDFNTIALPVQGKNANWLLLVILQITKRLSMLKMELSCQMVLGSQQNKQLHGWLAPQQQLVLLLR